VADAMFLCENLGIGAYATGKTDDLYIVELLKRIDVGNALSAFTNETDFHAVLLVDSFHPQRKIRIQQIADVALTRASTGNTDGVSLCRLDEDQTRSKCPQYSTLVQCGVADYLTKIGRHGLQGAINFLT